MPVTSRIQHEKYTGPQSKAKKSIRLIASHPCGGSETRMRGEEKMDQELTFKWPRVTWVGE